VIVVYRHASNFSAISWQEQVNFQWDDDEVRFVLDKHAELDFYSDGSLKQQSAGTHVAPQVDMSLHLDTLFWFRADQSLLFLLNAACLVEKQQIPISVFALTWPGLESTIYCTRGQHANHYTIDAVLKN
jgi:hypothetical protein